MRENSASSADGEKFDASSDTGLQDTCGARHVERSVNETAEAQQLRCLGLEDSEI